MKTTSNHKAFLRQVAEYFATAGNLTTHCFVMPTRRACTFFKTYLLDNQRPTVITIDDFLAKVTALKRVDAIDALFLLHKCYVERGGGGADDFDRFVHWGGVVLNDFNDVDMALVNADDVFTNIRQWREIATDYLTDEVKRKIESFLNVELSRDEEPRFWRHYTPDASKDTEEGEVEQRYVALWQVLAPLYHDFRERLLGRGEAYKGMIYREAVNVLREKGVDDFRFSHYAFVGFNMLSRSEEKIFAAMQKKGFASFFWDDASPAFKLADNIGGQWIKRFAKEFPSPPDFIPEKVGEFPEIHVMAVPSNVGQAKCAFEVVEQLIDNNEIAIDGDGLASNAINTAIVLPDEGLLQPLLGSVSPRVSRLNITMGYSMRGSDIVSLMRVVSRTHRHARVQYSADAQHEKQWAFFRDDVKDVLSHPVVKSFYQREAMRLEELLNKSNAFSVSESVFDDSPLKSLFTTVRQAGDVDAVVDYLNALIAFVDSLLEIIPPTTRSDEDIPTLTIQAAFLTHYKEALERMALSFNAQGLNVTEDTLFYLVDRLVSMITLPFEGDPLQGLQVMGLLETRCLDFDNMIVLSANERTLPRRYSRQTIISDVMRMLFGMATIEHQDANWAYYFYHLIARAKNVFLIYDARGNTLSGGEPSRYVAQLEMLYGGKNLKLHKVNFDAQLPTVRSVDIKVPKNERIMRHLNSYLASWNGIKKYLSASAIKDFVACPLKFYLKRVEGLNVENEKEDFMDAATFGSIVHETLQHLYYPDVDGQHRSGLYRVTAQDINDFRRNVMRDVILAKINKLYLHREQENAPLKGEPAIVMETIVLYVEKVLNYDLALLGNNDKAFVEVWECETEHEVTLKLGKQIINLTFFADRIDRINGTGPLRLIDYKTGRDGTDFDKIDDLFTASSSRDKREAIMQLFLYANAIVTVDGFDYSGPIMPMIYKLRKMSETGVFYKKAQLADVAQMNDEFLTKMGEIMDNLFNPQEPFTQVPEGAPNSPCRYCHFSGICHR